jgi:transposase
MKKEPIFVRPLTSEEQQQLRAGRRSAEAFTLRRCQILLLSAEGHTPRQIARQLGCTDQTARNAIHAFNQQGEGCLCERSSRPKSAAPIFDEAKCGRLKALLHSSPREAGKARSIWTLALVAEVCFENKLTESLVSDETIRTTLKRMGVNWQRARAWISSPDPAYARKKRRVTG